MRARRIGFAAWLLLTACLYFFENNTGTRVILICSLLFPLVPLLRGALFAADRAEAEPAPRPLTVRTFVRRESDEPGDIRPYRPGDPIRRIHWKLSAKRDELLVREAAPAEEAAEEERTLPPSGSGGRKGAAGRIALLPAALILLCAALLLLIPEARAGAQALCNRLFAASERLNAYAYAYFPVPEGQPVALAAILLIGALAALAALTALCRRGWAALWVMAACSLLQAYFGLSFPAWVSIPLYSLLALAALKRSLDRRRLPVLAAAVLLVTLLTMLLLPGVDPPTEAASEAVRDRLSQMAEGIAGSAAERPGGETAARHVHSLSLETGENAARAEREYRLVTVEEEQIAMPRWINWLRVFLLSVLGVALIVLPFAPFLVLNARKRKAEAARQAFASEDVGEAVCAIFRQVILWLEGTGHSPGNLLYRDWPSRLPAGLAEGYPLRFARCAADWEEAAYSAHALPEEKRQRALDLLAETEDALWKAADWRQRLRLRYWLCLHE